MKPTDLAAVTQWITAAALEDGDALVDRVATRLSLSRRSAQALLRKLEATQWLVREGTRRRPRFRPGPLRQVVQRYALEGLQEDLPWSRDFAPNFTLPREIARLAQHAFTELLNNAVDHSGGTQVTVSMRQTPLHLQLLVSDDGCGLFHRIEGTFQIADPSLAMLELSKGKLTTQPDRHSGRGLFFTSRMADVLDLHANERAYQYRGWDRRTWHKGKPIARPGTSIFLAISVESTRTVDGVLRSHSATGNGFAFDQTVVPLQLMLSGDNGLESRAQAKRVASRLQSFRRAEVDFTGIPEIGHGFADELFRVFPHAYPALELVPVGMSSRVAEMIDSVRQPALA